jgi:hypothetical protein
MPLTFRRDDDLLEVTASGSYSGEDVVRDYRAAFAGLPLGRRYGFVVDTRESTSYLTMHDFERMMDVYQDFSSVLGRIAVVVGDDAHFGGARQSGALLENRGFESRPFRDIDKARAWVRAEPRVHP